MPTNPYAVFSDGSTTITFADGSGGLTNYPMDWRPWAPAIPTFNPLAFAGRGQYSDVVEEMVCTIRGSSPSDCYAKQDALARLLDQAERWRWGENVSAVLYKIAPQGSAISDVATPLQAAILGRAPGDKSAVKLSARWVEAGRLAEIQDVKIRVWKRTPWLFTTATTASVSNINNGTIATAAFAGAVNTLSPMKIDMSNYPSAATAPGFLIVSSNDGFTRMAQADPSGGGAVGWAAVNESANFSRNTNVLRYTPAGTTESTSGPITITTTGKPLLAVFANVRNNSSTTNFQLRAQLSVGGGYITGYTPLNYIAPFIGAAAPGWVNLGYVALPLGTSTMRFLATASAAAGSLDIGDVLIVDVRYPGTYVIGYTPSESNGIVKNLVVDHAMLTLPEPTTLGTYPFSVDYDMAVQTEKQNIVVANLITSASANDWRQTFAGAVTQNNFTLTRNTAYLTPV